MTKANLEDYTVTVHVEWHSRILNTSNRTVLPLHLKAHTCGHVGMAWRSCGELWELRFTHQQGNCQPPFTTDISPKHDHKIWTQKMTSTCVKLWYKVFNSIPLYSLIWTFSDMAVTSIGQGHQCWYHQAQLGGVYHHTKHGLKHLMLLIAANKSPVQSFCCRLTSLIKKLTSSKGFLFLYWLLLPAQILFIHSSLQLTERKEWNS